jgi:uncharacterized membrane protein YkvA (DUF1232 family)
VIIYYLLKARYIQGNSPTIKGILYLNGDLLNVISPRDLVPDFLVGWGCLDDLVVLLLLWSFYRRQMQRRRTGSCHDKIGQTENDQRSNAANGGYTGRWHPYVVFMLCYWGQKLSWRYWLVNLKIFSWQ